MWWHKNKKRSGRVTLRVRAAMEESLLSVLVSWSIGQLRSVDEYSYLLNSGFVRTRSQILCSCLSGERRISDSMNIFSQTMSMKVICESFLPWMIPNLRYSIRWFGKYIIEIFVNKTILPVVLYNNVLSQYMCLLNEAICSSITAGSYQRLPHWNY